MMKRRILAMVLAGALVLALAACGGGQNGGASTEPGGGSGQADGSVPDGPVTSGGPAAPDAPPVPGGPQAGGPTPDVSLPDDGGGAETAGADPGAGGTPGPAGADIKLTLNRTSIELNKAGASFKLRYTVEPDIYDGLAVFTSSDVKVATVDETDGTVKAVAPGKATITVKYDSAVATAAVSCNWTVETEKPDTSNPADSVPDVPPIVLPGAPSVVPDGDASAPSGDASVPDGDASAPDGDAPAFSGVDLSAFYSAITGKYEFPMPMLADDEILDNFYSGITGIGAEQRLIYICGTSMNTGEFGLVQVKDGKDADAVKAIFQARIDAQAGGGAWYPMAVESWTNNARVVSNGNYVMMVVHESCDDIVKEFNALF